MDEIADALFDHLKERFPRLMVSGGPNYQLERSSGYDYIMTIDYVSGFDVQARIGRLELRGTVLHIYTDMDFKFFQFTDKKCGELDLTAPDSIERLDEWVERQVVNAADRSARSTTPTTPHDDPH